MAQLHKEKEDFGKNDDDWNLYRGLNADDISEGENDEIAINEIELELRELDPSNNLIKILMIRFRRCKVCLIIY